MQRFDDSGRGRDSCIDEALEVSRTWPKTPAKSMPLVDLRERVVVLNSVEAKFLHRVAQTSEVGGADGSALLHQRRVDAGVRDDGETKIAKLDGMPLNVEAVRPAPVLCRTRASAELPLITVTVTAPPMTKRSPRR